MVHERKKIGPKMRECNSCDEEDTYTYTNLSNTKIFCFPWDCWLPCLCNGVLDDARDRGLQGRLLTYEMVAGEKPENDEDSPPVDEATLLKVVTRETFFVDFMRTDEFDEDGVSRGRVLCERVYLCLLANRHRKALRSHATLPP